MNVVTIKNLEQDVIFEGVLDVVPAMSDTIHFSDGRQFTVTHRHIEIDLKGIEQSKAIVHVN